MKEEHIKMLQQVKTKASDTTRIGQPETKPKPQPTMKQIMAAWTLRDWRNAK